MSLMRLSLSSFVITLIMVTILILVFHFLLIGKKSHIWFRTDFLTIVFITILFRILLPIEFPFTISFKSASVMTSIRDIMLFEPISGFSIITFLIILWGVGILIQGIRYLLKIKKLCILSTQIQKIAKHQVVTEELSQAKYNLYFTDAISTPMVIGLKNNIYLPKLQYTKKELSLILMHEFQHIHHKDLLIKNLINVVVILYWWFPPIYLLQKQIDLYLEMRTDNAVVKNMNKNEYLDYAQAIVDIKKKQIEAKEQVPSPLSTCFISDGSAILKYRIEFLLGSDPKRKTKRIFLFIAFLLPFLSNMIIFEPYYENAPETEDTYDLNDLQNGYILHHKDDTYTLEIDGQSIGIQNPHSELFNLLRIIEE